MLVFVFLAVCLQVNKYLVPIDCIFFNDFIRLGGLMLESQPLHLCHYCSFLLFSGVVRLGYFLAFIVLLPGIWLDQRVAVPFTVALRK